MNTKLIITILTIFAFTHFMAMKANADELSYYGVLEVEHLAMDHHTLNEKENDAWVLTYERNGWTVGYGRYLNSYYDPSIVYFGGYTYQFDRLSLIGGIGLVTGYKKHLETQFAGMITPPIVGARYDFLRLDNVGPCKQLKLGATYLIMAIVETKGLNLTCQW
jgi:hypothetical protein